MAKESAALDMGKEKYGDSTLNVAWAIDQEFFLGAARE
jgi:hypothetical protein